MLSQALLCPTPLATVPRTVCCKTDSRAPVGPETITSAAQTTAVSLLHGSLPRSLPSPLSPLLSSPSLPLHSALSLSAPRTSFSAAPPPPTLLSPSISPASPATNALPARRSSLSSPFPSLPVPLPRSLLSSPLSRSLPLPSPLPPPPPFSPLLPPASSCPLSHLPSTASPP